MLVALALHAALASVAPTSISEAVMVTDVFQTGRRPVAANKLVQKLLDGRFSAPAAGDPFENLEGKLVSWQPLSAGKDGWMRDDALAKAYVFARWEAPQAGSYILKAQGGSLCYINGALRGGDPYSFGTLNLPFTARPGMNGFLFQCVRGQLKIEIAPAVKPLYLQADGATLPDIVTGDTELFASITIVNAHDQMRRGLALSVNGVVSVVPPVGSNTIRKAPFRFMVPKAGSKIVVVLLENGKPVDQKVIDLRTRTTAQTARRTFQSKVDGSVQTYSVMPASKIAPDNALILSLHGASVDALSQANAYGQKSWATIVCPTNRGPYSFDWEDWGRLDALEVLADAGNRYPHDAFRTSLTGHSMGGHGTWHVGTLFPDRFAAIAPSAGWASFTTYAGGWKPEEPNEVELTMQDATLVSEPMPRLTNLKANGVYVLHGDKDDNVPVTEARAFKDALSKFHTGFGYWEQPGENHWWSVPGQTGAACVDWAPMFDQFARRRIPKMNEVRSIDFSTPAPNVSFRSHWARILQQLEPFKISNIQADLDSPTRTFRVKLTNVQCFSLDVSGSLGDAKPVTVNVDGTQMKNVAVTEGKVMFTQNKGWKVVTGLSADEKNPLRGSGFKNALRKNWIICYGTSGSQQENAWMASYARYLSEVYSYRANATPYVVADKDLNPQVAKQRDILIIGNESLNAAWKYLLKGSPIHVDGTGTKVGSEAFAGEDKVALFCRPSSGVDTMVAAIGVTGLKSMRLAEVLPIFTSGVAYPDYCVISTDALEKGTKGIVAAGWFDNKWNLKSK